MLVAYLLQPAALQLLHVHLVESMLTRSLDDATRTRLRAGRNLIVTSDYLLLI